MAPADASLATLMALRVKGRATAATLAAAAGITPAAAETALAALVAAGHAARVADRFAPTAAGRARLRVLLGAEPIDRGTLDARYDAFLACDARVKAAVTAWQLAAPAGSTPTASPGARPPGAGGDERARLAALRRDGEAAHALAAELGALVPRLLPYAGRLAAALAALERGDTRFVASPGVDSLHQVWFELHEDLLLTLGRERGA